MQAFVDDSGGKGQGPAFVFAGLMGAAEEWAIFSDDWQACLQRAPAIKHFHMHEAVGLNGQFAHWQKTARDEKLRALVNVMNRPALRAIHCIIPDLDGYSRELEKGGSRPPFSDPYFHPFHMMISAVCYDLLERGHRDQCEIIFDEQLIFGPRAKLWYPIVRMGIDLSDLPVFPAEPLFRNDELFVPLQAADMLAWLLRREAAGQSHDFHWIPSALSAVGISPHSQVITPERIKGILAQSKEIKLPRATIEKGLNILGAKEVSRLRGRKKRP